jgi:uncharacterized membrane protein YhaH (DUF805 family)
MGFDDAVLKCLSKYASCHGRARLSEFWWFMTVYFSVPLLTMMALPLSAELATVGVLVTLLLTPPAVAVTVRRLHDVGRTGWMLVLLIPVAGQILMLAWLARPGVRRLNRFGPEPEEAAARYLLYAR